MMRLTVSLPDEVVVRLKREARRRRIPVSQLVRAALEPVQPDRARRLGFAAIGRSGHRDTSRHVDDILRAEWDRDRDR
jgi:hypothetical protein